MLFIGNVQNRKEEEEWKQIPMKVKFDDFLRPPIKKASRAAKVNNRFKVLEVDEEDWEECGCCEMRHIRTVAESGSTPPRWRTWGRKSTRDKMRNEVQCIRAVNENHDDPK